MIIQKIETWWVRRNKCLFDDKRKRYLYSYQERNLRFDRRRLFGINMKLLPWWKQISSEERAVMKELKELKKKKREVKQELRKIRRKT